MRVRLTLASAAALATAVLPTAALAHPAIGDAHGFVHGFAHPLSGLDHVLAMITVGIFAWQLGGRALWLVPGTFVVVMALAGLAGMAGIGIVGVEIGIAASVIVLGAIVALGVKPPVAIAMGIVAIFAVFHGHSHGTEMPFDVAGAAYALGFMLATALLHAAGIGVGMLVGRIGDAYGRLGYRVSGALVALAGFAILAHAI